MDVLKKFGSVGVAALLTLTALQCSVEAPLFADGSALAVSVVAAKTVTQPPSELSINLSNARGFQALQTVSSPASNGRAVFPRVPFGHLFIDINGTSQQVRSLYGHGETEVEAPNASVSVFLRNIVTVKNLDAAQESNFLQSTAGRSPFWDAVSKQSTALCTTVDGQTVLRATIAASSLYFYFLFEVTDDLFFPDTRPATGIGEFSADAVIVYLCKITPYNLSIEKQPFPAVRFQCEMGRNIPADGLFNLTNLASPDEVRNGPLANFTTDEINARILRTGVNQRLCEVRIRKNLLALPDDMQKGTRLFGMVARYRDSDNASLPAVLSDWQTGAMEMNPRLANEPWGYIEVTQ